MPSSLSHAMVAVALGTAIAPRPLLKPFLIVGSVCAVLPDIDALGRVIDIGVQDIEALGGHRGFTHSLTAAALTGVILACATFASPHWRGCRIIFAVFIGFVTAAHGVLDAFTTIGAITSPVQFFSPFSSRGYVSPWLPIMGPLTELVYVLLPLVAITRVVCHLREIPWPRRSPTEPVTLDL